MKDIIYAGFAQLSYLNWHNSGREINKKIIRLEGKKLIDIFKDRESFEILKNSDYAKIYSKGQDYLRIEEGKKIYHKSDARAYFLYSEDKVNGEKKPKYPEFGEWEFIYGYDHIKMYNEMVARTILEEDSGFQASVFKKDNNVVIAYRGSDDNKEFENLVSDWGDTNYDIGTNKVPDALTCAVWLFDKVVTMYKNRNVN